MSDQTTQEPTMEEILASIRRIISEDDAPAAEEAAEPAAPAVVADVVPMALEEPVVAHAVADDDEDDGVLELTDRVETHGDLDVYTPVAPPEPMPAPVMAAPAPVPFLEPAASLTGSPAASAAAAAFGHLTSTVQMPRDGRSLEDVTRELLRPLLKDWLDANLPRIVQDAVQSEVERISRGRV